MNQSTIREENWEPEWEMGRWMCKTTWIGAGGDCHVDVEGEPFDMYLPDNLVVLD